MKNKLKLRHLKIGKTFINDDLTQREREIQETIRKIAKKKEKPVKKIKQVTEKQLQMESSRNGTNQKENLKYQR